MRLRERVAQSHLRESIYRHFGAEFCDRLRTHLFDPIRGAVLLEQPDGREGRQATQRSADDFESGIARLICAVGCLVGQPYSHWNRGSAVFRNQLCAADSWTRQLRRPDLPDPLHTDTLCPMKLGEDFAVFGCVRRQECEGGSSELLHLDDWDHKDLLESPEAQADFLMACGDPEFQGRCVTRPVFSIKAGVQQICWSPRNVLAANLRQAAWLDAMRESLHTAPRSFSKVLAPGSILAFSNTRWLHGRSPLHLRPGLDRLLLAAHVSR